MERKELLLQANKWLANYQENILPCLKTNVVYAPSDLAYFCDQVADLTLFKLYYDMTEDMTEEEKEIKESLEKACDEINNILMEKDAELDELNGLSEEPCEEHVEYQS